MCSVIVSDFNILSHKQKHVTCCICSASVLNSHFKSPDHLMSAEEAPSFSKV